MRTPWFWRSLTVFLALAGCLVAVGPAAPARAGAAAALDRCHRNLVPEIDTTISVNGNGGGSFPAEASPSNAVEPGDVFYVIPLPRPTVSMGWGVGDFGPDGTGQPAPSGFPFPGMNKYSAILRFNNNPNGWVDSPRQATSFDGQCVQWTNPSPVRTLFYVNDDHITDNNGAWRIRILVYKASAPESSPALDRCRAPQAPDLGDDSDPVYGNGGGSFPRGSNPDNVLNDGDVFEVRSNDSTTVGTGWGSPTVGAYGTGVPAPSGWPYPGLFQYSAVLRFNNNPGGWVGEPQHAAAFGGCHIWHGPPVRLLFGVNDPNTTDNSGAWLFSIYIYKA